jgi:hypothetical protein
MILLAVMLQVCNQMYFRFTIAHILKAYNAYSNRHMTENMHDAKEEADNEPVIFVTNTNDIIQVHANQSQINVHTNQINQSQNRVNQDQVNRNQVDGNPVNRQPSRLASTVARPNMQPGLSFSPQSASAETFNNDNSVHESRQANHSLHKTYNIDPSLVESHIAEHSINQPQGVDCPLNNPHDMGHSAHESHHIGRSLDQSHKVNRSIEKPYARDYFLHASRLTAHSVDDSQTTGRFHNNCHNMGLPTTGFHNVDHYLDNSRTMNRSVNGSHRMERSLDEIYNRNPSVNDSRQFDNSSCGSYGSHTGRQSALGRKFNDDRNHVNNVRSGGQAALIKDFSKRGGVFNNAR